MRRGTGAGVPPWSMAVAAMLLIQLCNALSVGLVSEVGAAGTSWLRLSMGALVFMLIARPPLHLIRRADVPALLGLGAATGLMTTAFLAAIDRIPLGTAVAIEFLGPLAVAAIRSGSRRMLAWPGLALAGVVLLTEPWQGAIDLAGIGFAALAGLGWGVYILLTQRVGDRFSGISGLSITIPIAAVMTAFIGVPEASGSIDGRILLIALGLALLAPVLPFGLEMLALRRMSHSAFGTLMAVEPALGVLIGLLVLLQTPSPYQIAGIVLVVLAGAGAQRHGARPLDPEPADARTRPEDKRPLLEETP
ncbi:EamA family transporter [Zhihengliuella halotolerans]|uniref:Inner membrane transporter RhtA n=1 Tax=Zhihengliuella halotolerans TaxID=370736 RepID=A0A4V2GA66_9MICC|nr:EamA family transporter [Zhihengliuella halotolerans]RZU63056.1 inner membrane transporter RhtA [Zhihengliuella halotolerans]